MKKFKRIAYIILLIIIVVLSLTIYTNASKDDGETKQEKVKSEIRFVETKLINLLNNLNSIKIDNYNIITTEISKNSTESGNTSSGGNQTGGGESGGQSSSEQQSKSEGGTGEQQSKSENQSGSQQSQGGSESGDKQSQGSSKDQTAFDLQRDEILVDTQDINWDSIKSETENLYGDLPSITMDLYQMNNVKQEDILNFNKEYDNLITIVKDEKKQEALTQLTKIYEYLPRFLKSTEQDELYTTLVETKVDVFKGYSKLDEDNWSEISTDVKNAINTYSKLLTNTNIEKQKKSNISKGYVMINELQNAVSLKDKSVFLIKYKNLLEEINKM